MLNIKNYNKIQKKLPRVVNNIDDLRDLFNSEQIELDLLNENIDFLISSAFIHDLKKLKEQGYNIERSLQKWEFIYGINPKRYQSDVERIDTIIAKMKIRETTTKKVIEDICKSFGQEVIFRENYSNYSFFLRFIKNTSFQKSMFEIIDDVKPAHLGYILEVVYQMDLYFGMYGQQSRYSTMLPADFIKDYKHDMYIAYYPITTRLIKTKAINPPIEDIAGIETLNYGMHTVRSVKYITTQVKE